MNWRAVSVRTCIVAALCALAVSLPAPALDPDRSLTQYLHRIQQIQQGLQQATIFSILQSHDGYLWLGTQRGLVRFDGVRFTPFDGGDGISLENTWVRSLLEDEQHNLWIGTNDSGLIKLRNGAMTQYSVGHGFPSEGVHCLITGRNGELWACTPNGLVRISDAKFTAYTEQQGLSTNNIRGACVAPDGKVWSGGDSTELNIWDGARFTRYPLSLPKQATVRAILCANDGAVWVGTTNGLIRIKGGAARRFTVADGLADDWIDALAEGSHASLWIGTKNGFSRFLNGEIESFRPKDGLSQSTVYSLREDREGNLWVGTKHGLDQFFEGRTIPFTASEGLPSNDTGPVFQDRNGNIWVGTLGAGLARSNGRHFTVLTAKEGLASDTIFALGRRLRRRSLGRARTPGSTGCGTDRLFRHTLPRTACRVIQFAASSATATENFGWVRQPARPCSSRGDSCGRRSSANRAGGRSLLSEKMESAICTRLPKGEVWMFTRAGSLQRYLPMLSRRATWTLCTKIRTVCSGWALWVADCAC